MTVTVFVSESDSSNEALGSFVKDSVFYVYFKLLGVFYVVSKF